MRCGLGFDNSDEGERNLPRKNLYDAAMKLRKILEEDAKTERGHFNGVKVVMTVPLNKPFEIEELECKGWYHERGSGSTLVASCSSCRYCIR